MASISSDKNGRKRLLVILSDGSRKSIRLGKLSMRQAQTIKIRVEALAGAKLSGGTLDDETLRWLSNLDDDLHAKLTAIGLVRPRESMRLGALVDAWLERRNKTLKAGTVVRLQQGKRSLIEHFGKDRAITSITEGEVEDYRAALLTQGLAEATVRKRCSDARVWFRYAVRHGYIRTNPFEAVPTSAIETANLAYISEHDARSVLDMIGDADLRLIFVLARWGGLRTISEPKLLTWDCVDWERSRLTIKSPKTERHQGHEQRIIPIFPELVEELQAAFDRAKPGQTHVLPVLQRITSAALCKPMVKAIKAAGVKPWRRLWQNLRSSRQTDLEQRFPSHVVCAWLGNSPSIARKHYLQVLDSDFQKAAQKAAQQPAADSRNESQSKSTNNAKTPDNPVNCDPIPVGAATCENGENRLSDPDGVITKSVSPGKTPSNRPCGAESGARNEGLSEVVAAWPSLTPEQRSRVLKIVRGAL